MVKKFVFLAGMGVGYLVGSKGGREKLMQLWNDPKVQDTVSQGTEWAKEKAPVLQDKVGGAAKDAASSAKDAASKAAPSGSGSTGSASGSTSGSSTSGSSTSGSSSAGDFTSGGDNKMSPAEPQPEI